MDCCDVVLYTASIFLNAQPKEIPMRKLSQFVSIAVALLFASIASAETFTAQGASITAVQEGDNVIITVTGIPAAKLVHFRGQGDKSGSIHVADMKDGRAVLETVSKNGARFQLKDATGKWLLITPTGNSFKMTGVAQECRKSRGGCALEVKAKA